MFPEEGQGLRVGHATQKEFLHFANVDVSWAVLDHVGNTEKPQSCAVRVKAEDGRRLGGLRVRRDSSFRGEGEEF